VSTPEQAGNGSRSKSSMHTSLTRFVRRGLLAVSAALALAGAAQASPAVWAVRATAKVHPSAPVQTNAGVNVSGARNEFVSFQVVVNGGQAGANNVTASLSGLSGPSAIGGNDVTLYRETLLNVATATSAGASTGQYPDGLVPDVDEIAHEKRNAFPFSVPANQSRAIWVDVHVPAGAAPGSYSGSVAVSADGFSDSVPVTLTVLNATLPSTSSLASAFLIFDGNVCRAHTGASDCGSAARRDQLVNEYARLALDHRFTLSNVFRVPSGSDWSGFDSSYGPLLDGTAATRLSGAKATSLQYTGARTSAGYSAFDAHVKARGWLSRAFDYTADEPPYGSTWAAVASRAAVVRSAAPDLRTLVTTTIQESSANGVASDIDTMVPVVNQLDGTGAPYSGDMRASYDGWLSGKGKQLWMYQSCMSHGCAYGTNAGGVTSGSWPSYMIDAAASHNRAMQWDAFLEKVSGELYYETADMLPSAWSDQWAFNGNGDGTLFYPGTPAQIGGKTDVPVPSIRMKLLRMGMQDYEWLKLVADSGDPAFAEQVARSLIPKSSQVSADGAAFDAARQQLEQRYLQLHPVVVADNGGSDAGTSTNGGTDAGTGTDTGSGGAGLGGGSSSASASDQPVKIQGCGAAGVSSLAPFVLIGLACVRRRAASSRHASRLSSAACVIRSGRSCSRMTVAPRGSSSCAQG
jgi:hypothetical protein